MSYNSQVDVVCMLTEWYDTKSNVKLGGFRSQLQASYVSSHPGEFWYKETVGLYVYNYICIYICTNLCIRDVVRDYFKVEFEFRVFFLLDQIIPRL